MLDLVFGSMRALAEAWKREAAEMRRFSATNPIADTREYDAAELLERVRELERASAALTPEQYARLHHVTPEAVRKWCRAGKIPGAVRAGHTWTIPAGARPRLQQKRAS